MAESAANFTFTSQNKPSIFEVIAQNSLDNTLHPGLRKIALFLTSNFPGKCTWLEQHYDEVFLALNFALQANYLKRYNSTFSENFYGLQRCIENNNALNDYHRAVSLFTSVIVPYFKRKLDEKINFYRLEEADGCFRNNFEGNCKKLVIFAHSSFELTWSLLTVYNYLRYMAGKVEGQLPLLRLLHLKLGYAGPEEAGPSLWGAFSRGDFSELWRFRVVKDGVAGALTVVAFFMQFLESWNSQKGNYSVTALPSVKAPPLDGRARNYTNKCPLCLQHWKIPTVLPVSGYVFCFPCILRYLKDNQKCPVTHLPAKPLDIVRIYDNE